MSAPSPDSSALASAVYGGFGSSFSCGCSRDSAFSGHGCDSSFNGCGFSRGFDGRDSGSGGCSFSRGGRISGGGDCGHGRGSRLCTRCGGTNHTVESCYDLHGFP